VSRASLFRTAVVLVLAAIALMPSAGTASSLPSGERALGGATIEPAYNDFDGSITYLLTPNHLAPLSPTNPLLDLNSHAVAPLYLVVYPPGTSGTFNCMGVPGNCPDHDGTIAGVATSVRPGVYGTTPSAVPGHDHLVGLPHTGDFNFAWHVFVELFNSTAAVRHITTLADLQSAWAANDVVSLDSGITFGCAVVSEHTYLAGTPA
jgi:hypothetical protein